ncbi:hypothetical protein F5146DRAFT_1002198 [Armillaria mellea]|nr:hypothetical protein F5146DRAFT_1002198 [Armillaria mellea]
MVHRCWAGFRPGIREGGLRLAAGRTNSLPDSDLCQYTLDAAATSPVHTTQCHHRKYAQWQSSRSFSIVPAANADLCFRGSSLVLRSAPFMFSRFSGSDPDQYPPDHYCLDSLVHEYIWSQGGMPIVATESVVLQTPFLAIQWHGHDVVVTRIVYELDPRIIETDEAGTMSGEKNAPLDEYVSVFRSLVGITMTAKHVVPGMFSAVLVNAIVNEPSAGSREGSLN